MNAMAAESLDLVSAELVTTLDEARELLEQFVDGDADRSTLTRCADLMHLATGALKIAEVHGAAFLAEEIEETCRHLAMASEQDALDDGTETLVRAMVQLPAYLDRLLSGGKDLALVLLPLLNDLRRHRGQSRLSEGSIVLFKHAPPVAEPEIDPSRALSEEGVAVFRRLVAGLRIEFQAALLGWIRDQDTEDNLAELVRVSGQLEHAASLEPVRQLWYVLVGVLEALQDGGLETSVALKRLVGQADRQLKRLQDDGEAAFLEAPPVELLNSFLYYAARASGDSERLAEIRSTYGLSEIVPEETHLVKAREGLAGPSVKLMQAVAAAIREDLGTVKDSLDIFVRTGMENLDDLEPQFEMLKKIGDTLGVLGMADARDAIQEQAQSLKAIVDNDATPDSSVLEQAAATLLGVEDALVTELVRSAVPSDREDSEESPASQYRRATASVVGECIVNLARVKEAIVDLVKEPGDVRVLDQVGPQLKGITAGLMMLGKTDAVGVTERIGAIVASRLAPGVEPLSALLTERLADAVVSLEYYLETISVGRQDPWYMLENARRCLDLLENESRSPDSEELSARVEALEAEAAQPTATVTLHPAVMTQDSERPNPELVEIFIEEAKEEIAKIRQHLPVWQQNRENAEALISARRSFHTLKGSGRMVGAEIIGEFAWSVENLLNRIINQTLEPDDDIVAFLARAMKFLPELVEQLEIGTEPATDASLLIRQAHAFAEGDPAASVLLRTEVAEAGSGEEAAREFAADEDKPQMDPVLADIFVKEMRGHLATIRDAAAAIRSGSEPAVVAEPLFRASHTLLGSANMAGHQPAITLSEPLAGYLARLHETAGELAEEGLDALEETADALERMADALGSGQEFTEDTAPLRSRLGELVEAHRVEVDEAPNDQVTEQVDFDPEIAAIFAEEAAELLESAELALQDMWSGEPSSDRLVELKRLLHTLKGGARMAGIPAMGDLSHALEDLIAGLGDADASDEIVSLAQRSLDDLHQMRDSIGAGQPLSASSELLGALAAAARGIDAPALRAPESDAEADLAPDAP
ncbi:MAG TPA: Hpt domain-containing protein, partial [Gammaproteobacteria bacterium]